MASLEMIGYFRSERGTQEYPTSSLASRMPDTGDFIAVVGRAADEALVDSIRDAMSIDRDVPVYGYAAPDFVQGIDFSDHRSYWAVGFPAVMITDTAFLRNHAYHEAEDTPDTLDYQRMKLVVDGVFSAIMDTSTPRR
jgi:hypothetical protein